MTLLIAMRCSDGVLMASDSQGTEGVNVSPHTQVRLISQKIHKLTSRSVWGFAGLVQVGQDARQEATAARQQLENSPDLRESLLSVVRPVLNRHYSAYLPIPGAIPSPPRTTTLACGTDNIGQPWILEIDDECRCTYYQDLGFHAIGSGAPFAQLANALMAHFEVGNRPLDHAKLVAYRVMDIAINTSAYGIGPPICMWTVDSKGTHQLNEEEIREVSVGVGLWQSMEVEALNDVFRSPSTKQTLAELPPEIDKGEDDSA